MLSNFLFGMRRQGKSYVRQVFIAEHTLGSAQQVASERKASLNIFLI
jgi:hypothetical protein